MIGAVFVSFEVVNQYRGQTHGLHMKQMKRLGLPPRETHKYVLWKENKHRKMKFGLGCLLSGFLIQVFSNWVHLIFG